MAAPIESKYHDSLAFLYKMSDIEVVEDKTESNVSIGSLEGVSIDSLEKYDPVERRLLYQQANENHKVELVRQLNGLGMKPDVKEEIYLPGIASRFMDISTKHDVIFEYLIRLRKSNRFFTKQEFNPLSSRKWRRKCRLSRLLGCDHIEKNIEELKLKFIHVPKKIAVLKDDKKSELTILGWNRDFCKNIYDIDSDDIDVYSEKITSVDRKLSRKEIDELIQIINASNFKDLCPENFIIASDGIYFIDTEFKSFDLSIHIHWEKLSRFVSMIDPKDQRYFSEKVEERMKDPIKKRLKSGYDALLQGQKNGSGEWKEVCDEAVSDLKYVGAAKAGTDWLKPNIFTFSLSGIVALKPEEG